MGEGPIHSALEIVAFTHHNKSKGVVALLEVALKALDEEGHANVSNHVDMALRLLKLETADRTVESAARKSRAHRKVGVH